MTHVQCIVTLTGHMAAALTRCANLVEMMAKGMAG